MADRFYKWGEFRTEVKNYLTVDANRLGAETLIEKYIRQAVLDLQELIPAYRKLHEDIYHSEDFVVVGSASRGTLPPAAETREANVFNTTNDMLYPAVPHSWEGRHELCYGGVELPDSNARMAIDPMGDTFFIYPAITDDTVLSLWWDGIKADFDDLEETPFTEQTALAVAEFVKGKMSRDVEKDLALYNSYFHPREGSYYKLRRNLWLTAKERTRMKSR